QTTEYGGVLEMESEGTARAVVFPPRPRDRTADDRFVASQDMIDYGSTGLALYHFHVQKEVNSQFAGPSLADLETAARLGQTSLVVTSIGRDRLNVDLYQPDGAIIDLGEFRR
ncbi:MAG: hypothetical protein KDA28_15575, partial [Phycisphaerales bacterium]|nr:hypothetical protein [Phycisphaerales bacterium]